MHQLVNADARFGHAALLRFILSLVWCVGISSTQSIVSSTRGQRSCAIFTRGLHKVCRALGTCVELEYYGMYDNVTDLGEWTIKCVNCTVCLTFALNVGLLPCKCVHVFRWLNVARVERNIVDCWWVFLSLAVCTSKKCDECDIFTLHQISIRRTQMPCFATQCGWVWVGLAVLNQSNAPKRYWTRQKVLFCLLASPKRVFFSASAAFTILLMDTSVRGLSLGFLFRNWLLDFEYDFGSVGSGRISAYQGTVRFLGLEPNTIERFEPT